MRWWRYRLQTAFIWLVGFICFAVLAQAQQPTETTPTGDRSEAKAPVISIPDGTPVEMRFAHAVRGQMLNPVDVGVEGKEGEPIRLVAATNIWVEKKVVIAEGARAQATVSTVKRPLSTLVDTGLGLQLDWIEDVTGAHIPLRILQKGRSEPFMVQVVSTPGGALARPETLRGDLLGKNALDVTQIWRDRFYIPAGTRIVAYVHGTQALDAMKVEEAQASVTFSESPTDGDVVIYRTKSHSRERVRVHCDERFSRSIGEREFIRLNLSAGKHRCQIENQSPLELMVEAGREYFFHLRRSSRAWELRAVTAGEGEDSIENGDPAPRQ